MRGFRNYADEAAQFSPELTIIAGANGSGKTNLIEAVQYVLCGRSFRTVRESEMLRSGAGWFRIEAEISNGGVTAVRSAAYRLQGRRPLAEAGGPWRGPEPVLCFSPDDLQLIKGPPAARRRFLDEVISGQRPDYRRLALDYQKVLSQRNGFLKRARAGLLPLADIAPWDRQLAQLALKIHGARASFCRELSPQFAEEYRRLSGDTAAAPGVVYSSQISNLAGGEGAVLAALAEAWQRDMERLSTSVGVHRDDLGFRLDRRDLRPHGSQGEQRTAVLAVLLACRRIQMRWGATPPMLLLDDVMSELDPARRRLLMANVAGASAGEARGQVIITAADTGLFTKEELGSAAVIEVRQGVIARAGAGCGV